MQVPCMTSSISRVVAFLGFLLTQNEFTSGFLSSSLSFKKYPLSPSNMFSGSAVHDECLHPSYVALTLFKEKFGHAKIDETWVVPH